MAMRVSWAATSRGDAAVDVVDAADAAVAADAAPDADDYQREAVPPLHVQRYDTRRTAAVGSMLPMQPASSSSRGNYASAVAAERSRSAARRPSRWHSTDSNS